MAGTPQPFSAFSTTEMMETVQNLKTPQSGLVAKFFPTIKQSNSRFHAFETDTDKRYVAPFVSPSSPGKVRQRKGRQVTSVEAAYIKQNAHIRPSDALERQAGETLGGSSTPSARAKLLAAKALKDQHDAITRRQEIMAADALILGRNVLVGDDYPSVTLDYQRDASLGLDNPDNILSGNDRWQIAGSNPGKFLRKMSAACVRFSGSWTGDVFLDLDAYEALTDNAKQKEGLDLLRMDSGALAQMAAQTEGLMLVGTISTFRIWLYTGWYYDDATQNDVALFSGGNVVGVGAIDGVQGFGAIQDMDAFEEYPDGMIPEAIYPKSWIEKDPSALVVQSQCAPIVYPRRPNASWAAKVLG